MSFFNDVTTVPEDPILGLTGLFYSDPHARVNLGVGSYKDEQGHPLVLSAVRKAEQILLEEKFDKEYLSIAGDPAYIRETGLLLFGTELPIAEKSFGAQTLGGSGALRLGGDFLAQQGFSTIYLPSPSWGNHIGIFTRSLLKCQFYPYYNSQERQIDFKGWCNAIEAMEPNSIILLHGCCHNPTGMDPDKEQWKTLSELLKRKKILPFFDIAYQGFDSGLNEDVWSLRHFASEGHILLVASSYSKNMGLYSERVGSLFVFGQSKAVCEGLGSQVRQIIRGNYSNPPSHGARIVSQILQQPQLRQEWIEELTQMRQRIQTMRKVLAEKLSADRPDINWQFLHKQKGIFSFSGLNVEQVQKLRQEFGIYMLENGRISIAGLNFSNIDYTAQAFLSVLR